MGSRDGAVVVLSGGQDSTTCLYYARDQGFAPLHAVTFDYGQRHRREIEAARKVAEMAGVESHEVVELGPILKGTSPLVSGAELEQYESYEALPGGLEKTFVPMRNQLFLTIAANHAYILGVRHVFTGVCQADFGGYPDCRRNFVDSFETCSNLGTFTGEDGTLANLQVHTPLMYLSKQEAVELAVSLPGCYQALAHTHTSYDGEFPPVGRDHATLLRAHGFEAAGVPDPLLLRAHLLGLLPELPSTANYKDPALALELVKSVL